MRFVGGLAFLIFGAGLMYAVREVYRRGRPGDVLFALAAPICAILAVLGLVVAFVPDFLGG